MRKILWSAAILLASSGLLLASGFTEEQSYIYNALKNGNFDASDADVAKFNQLDMQLFASPPSSVVDVQNALPGITLHDAALLFNAVINGDDLTIDTLIYAYFIEYNPQVLAKQLTQISRPNSFSNTMIKNTMSGAMRKQFLRRPATSGDWFSDLYAAFDVSYTDYEDTNNNNSGKLHYQSVTFGGAIGEKTDLSFTISHNEANQKGADDIFARTLGSSFSLHHRLNDNYGIGVFGFYAQSEYRTIEDEVDTFGGGVLATASWELGEFTRLSSAHSLSAGGTEFGQDTMYMGMVKVSRDWTDYVSTGIYTYYADSLRTPTDGADTSYWTLGLDATFYLSEDVSLSLSYESVEALKNYSQKTSFASLIWRF